MQLSVGLPIYVYFKMKALSLKKNNLKFYFNVLSWFLSDENLEF